MSNTSKRNKVMSNLIWRFGERLGAQAVSFIVSTIIARIIDPSAYGICAIIMAITSILTVFVDSGLSSALIQKKDADDLDFSTVFYTNIVICLIMYFGLFASAPFLSVYFKMPDMTKYIRVLGLTVVVSAIANVQHAYISKQMIFKKFFFASLGGTIAAGVIGVWMAFNGFGIWALIATYIVDAIVDCAIIWLTIKWRPKLMFSFERLKGLFSYGSKLLLSSFVNKVYDKLYQFVIGRYYSAADLAFFDKGDSLSGKITSNIDSSINAVMMPVLSKDQDDVKKMKSAMRRMIQVSFYIMTPLLLGLAAVGEPFIKLLLTDKWLPAVPFLQIMCVIRVFKPIHTANLNVIRSMGRSDIFLKLEIIKSVEGVLVLFLVARFGVLAMAFSLLFSSFFSQIVNAWPTKKLINYPYLEQMKDVLPTLLVATVMALVVVNIPHFLPISNLFVVIGIQIIIGATLYIGISYIFKIEAFTYSLELILGFLKRKKKN